jgi:UDP-N-acetylglucosamine diphosphorylase / glucose-1-phosphate thymidylyltransferase / UDP-N-acetylgalactosamine diphosphorylase / glucosamine-1-phosphate N-acetyltransferase / galactosamine-1-phosphate N-acetyltransferase
MLVLSDYIRELLSLFPELQTIDAWRMPALVEQTLLKRIQVLSDEYSINGLTAVHRSARVEDHVVFKGPVIVSEGCFIGAHAYIRGGVYVGEQTVIGPGCEVKTTIIMRNSALAHFNFVGDSLIGSGVNMEAGSIIANHFNEREDKTIHAMIDGKKTALPVTKFGAIVGDRCRIGANAVLTPGTLLAASSIVKRLELIEQC